MHNLGDKIKGMRVIPDLSILLFNLTPHFLFSVLWVTNIEPRLVFTKFVIGPDEWLLCGHFNELVIAKYDIQLQGLLY